MKTWKLHGRRKAYTTIGIERLPCFRCGGKSYHQWKICADKGLYRPVCVDCDIALNKLVLEWMGFENAEELLQQYMKDNA